MDQQRARGGHPHESPRVHVGYERDHKSHSVHVGYERDHKSLPYTSSFKDGFETRVGTRFIAPAIYRQHAQSRHPTITHCLQHIAQGRDQIYRVRDLSTTRPITVGRSSEIERVDKSRTR